MSWCARLNAAKTQQYQSQSQRTGTTPSSTPTKSHDGLSCLSPQQDALICSIPTVSNLNPNRHLILHPNSQRHTPSSIYHAVNVVSQHQTTSTSSSPYKRVQFDKTGISSTVTKKKHHLDCHISPTLTSGMTKSSMTPKKMQKISPNAGSNSPVHVLRQANVNVSKPIFVTSSASSRPTCHKSLAQSLKSQDLNGENNANTKPKTLMTASSSSSSASNSPNYVRITSTSSKPTAITSKGPVRAQTSVDVMSSNGKRNKRSCHESHGAIEDALDGQSSPPSPSKIHRSLTTTKDGKFAFKVNVNVGLNCNPSVNKEMLAHEMLVQSSSDDEIDICSTGTGVSSAVNVAVRLRPFNAREKEKAKDGHEILPVVEMKNNQVKIINSGNENTNKLEFTFDNCLNSFVDVNTLSYDEVDDRIKHGVFDDQASVYAKMGSPLLDHAFEGYNVCLFAYGQTGSGKTYTMMGDLSQDNSSGITPRFAQDLFDRIKTKSEHIEFSIQVSYLEIYNEKIHDLLVENELTHQAKELFPLKKALRVREHPTLGPFVEELTCKVIRTHDDLLKCLEIGKKNRATAETASNEHSSRSHSIFTIVMAQTKKGDDFEHHVTSKVNLVDLAGSERVGKAESNEERFKEGNSINKSLLTLGKVISQLAENSEERGTGSASGGSSVHVPYRDSVLTFLLKESLGGNSRTSMIATISPAKIHLDETLSTLRYAATARRIVNVARINEDPKTKLIRKLKEEIQRLRQQQDEMRQTRNDVCTNTSEQSNTNHVQMPDLKLALNRVDILQSEQRKLLAEMQQMRTKLVLPAVSNKRSSYDFVKQVRSIFDDVLTPQDVSHFTLFDCLHVKDSDSHAHLNDYVYDDVNAMHVHVNNQVRSNARNSEGKKKVLKHDGRTDDGRKQHERPELKQLISSMSHIHDSVVMVNTSDETGTTVRNNVTCNAHQDWGHDGDAHVKDTRSATSVKDTWGATSGGQGWGTNQINNQDDCKNEKKKKNEKKNKQKDGGDAWGDNHQDVIEKKKPEDGHEDQEQEEVYTTAPSSVYNGDCNSEKKNVAQNIRLNGKLDWGHDDGSKIDSKTIIVRDNENKKDQKKASPTLEKLATASESKKAYNKKNAKNSKSKDKEKQVVIEKKEEKTGGDDWHDNDWGASGGQDKENKPTTDWKNEDEWGSQDKGGNVGTSGATAGGHDWDDNNDWGASGTASGGKEKEQTDWGQSGWD